MLLNRLTIFLTAAITIVAGCSPPGIKGDGVVTTESRAITDFSTLKADGAYHIKWSSGKPAITISTDQNLLPLITTTVTGDTLHIDWKENLRPSNGITIDVSSASLKGVQLNGAVKLAAGNVSGSDLKLESNGASSINVAGSVGNLEVNFSGACRLDAEALHTKTAKVSLSGACKADVTATEGLEASISGTGAITYGGNPKTVQKEVNGVGKIRPRE